MATISICIPSHNCGPYLAAAIDSALGQEDPAVEIIVSDDHSTDETDAVLHRYVNNARIRIVRQRTRLTLGEHYRALLALATGDYICFLSADDVLFSSATRRMRSALASAPALLIGAAVETDSALRVRATRGTARRMDLAPPDGFRYLAAGNLYTVSFSLMRADLLRETAWLPREADLATDWYWALMLARAGTLKFLSRPLGYYRIHGNNAGHANSSYFHATALLREWLEVRLSAEEVSVLRLASAVNPPSQTLFSKATSIARRAAKQLDAARYSRSVAIRRSTSKN